MKWTTQAIPNFHDLHELAQYLDAVTEEMETFHRENAEIISEHYAKARGIREHTDQMLLKIKHTTWHQQEVNAAYAEMAATQKQQPRTSKAAVQAHLQQVLRDMQDRQKQSTATEDITNVTTVNLKEQVEQAQKEHPSLQQVLEDLCEPTEKRSTVNPQEEKWLL